MTDKCAADGSYRIIYLQELLDRRFSAGTTQVICPITDAFVGHHGSLGGFLPVYCSVDVLHMDQDPAIPLASARSVSRP